MKKNHGGPVRQNSAVMHSSLLQSSLTTQNNCFFLDEDILKEHVGELFLLHWCIVRFSEQGHECIGNHASIGTMLMCQSIESQINHLLQVVRISPF